MRERRGEGQREHARKKLSREKKEKLKREEKNATKEPAASARMMSLPPTLVLASRPRALSPSPRNDVMSRVLSHEGATGKKKREHRAAIGLPSPSVALTRRSVADASSKRSSTPFSSAATISRRYASRDATPPSNGQVRHALRPGAKLGAFPQRYEPQARGTARAVPKKNLSLSLFFFGFTSHQGKESSGVPSPSPRDEERASAPMPSRGGRRWSSSAAERGCGKSPRATGRACAGGRERVGERGKSVKRVGARKRRCFSVFFFSVASDFFSGECSLSFSFAPFSPL